MEEELVKQIEKSELEMSIAHISGYVDEMDVRLEALEHKVACLDVSDHRLTTLEREFNCTNETRILLKRIKNELGIADDAIRSAVREGDVDTDEGGH